MTEPEIAKRVEFYVNALGTTVASMPLDPEIVFLPNDEIELPTIGIFRMIQRRWHVASDARVLILQLEELHWPVGSGHPRHRHGQHAALVLIDVGEAFSTPDRPASYPASTEVLGPLRELLDRAREDRRSVVHAVRGRRPGLSDFEHRKLPVHCEIGDGQSP
jgi:hypothetical protein